VSNYVGSVFLSTKRSSEDISRFAGSAIGGKESPLFSVESRELDISIKRNPDRDELAKFPIMMELAINEGFEDSGWKKIRLLLVALRTEGIAFETVPDDIADSPGIGPG